jgi:hypothetical protein
MPSVELQTLPKSGPAWFWIAQALVLVMPIASGITLHILPFLSQGKIKPNPLYSQEGHDMTAWHSAVYLLAIYSQKAISYI